MGGLVVKATVHHPWPLNNDRLHPPQHRLILCMPLWSDTEPVYRTSFLNGVMSEVQLLWSTVTWIRSAKATVVYSKPPYNQGHCGAWRKLWGMADSNLYVFDATQTMSHIVESCPLMAD